MSASREPVTSGAIEPEGVDYKGHPMYGQWLSYRDFEQILLALGASGSDVKRLWPREQPITSGAITKETR